MYITTDISDAIEFTSQGNPTTPAVNSGWGVTVGRGVFVDVVLATSVSAGRGVFDSGEVFVGAGADGWLHAAINKTMSIER